MSNFPKLTDKQWQKFAQSAFRNLPDGQMTKEVLAALVTEGNTALEHAVKS